MIRNFSIKNNIKVRNYVVTHLHSDLSNGTTNIDSVTKYQMYIDRAVELKMKAIAFSEHGNVFNWVKKKLACDEVGIKYIHAVEIYVTESLEEKVRDNYHVGMYARNWEGVKEINKLISIAHNKEDGHFYYTPRITIDELINTSNNIIITTACLGGILHKGTKEIREKFFDFLMVNKNRCFLEVQHHNVQHQINYNRKLYELSQATGLRLIAGTDTHSLNEDYADARIVLQRAKEIFFGDEEGWDLTFKSCNDLYDLYLRQRSIPMDAVDEAIQNTNVLADMVEGFEFDRSHKYPQLYDNPEEVFKERVAEGYIERGIDKKPISVQKTYKDRIREEMEVYKKTNSVNYMLFQDNVTQHAISEDRHSGYGRGSVNGSLIAYLLQITEMDSIKHNLNFFRFMNPSRISLADIDTDWSEKDREAIKNYLFNFKGLYSAEIITFNTIALKGSIRDAGRGLNIELNIINDICENIESNEEGYREEYPELFKYVDLLQGVIVSVGTHPSGVLISPLATDENVGLCRIKNNEHVVSMLNMKELDYLNYVKLDILGLDNIDIINRTCKLANIPRLTPDNMDIEDIDVWKNIRDNTSAVFQWESDNAQAFIKLLFSDETLAKIFEQNPNVSLMDIFSLGNGLIRPSGASIRSDASEGVFKDNGFDELNNFLSDTMGYCVYQEQIMMFLVNFCNYSMAEADIVRRGIAKKEGTEQHIPEIRKRFINKATTVYGLNITKAEEVIEPFIQIILDSSDYGFSVNHSAPYSFIGYGCGWLRYYYPLEFITSAMNVYGNKTEKVAKVTQYAHDMGIEIKPIKFRYSRGEYFCDKANNHVYKGTESVKNLNYAIGEELYELRNNEYSSFVEMLRDVTESTSCNKTQISILILLDFFEEFGSSKKLTVIYEQFQKRYKRTHKEDTKIRRIEELIIYELETPEFKFMPDEIMKYEIMYLGYCETTIPQIPSDYCLVANVDGKYKNKIITLVRMCDGKLATIKVKKALYDKDKLNQFDMIKIIETKMYNKWRKVGEKFEMLKEKEPFLTLWNKVE